MRFSQRKCSSREVLQPLDCHAGNPCPTAIPYQADRLGGRISADEQATVLYGRGSNPEGTLRGHLPGAGRLDCTARLHRPVNLRLKGGKREEPTKLSGFSRSQLDPSRAGKRGSVILEGLGTIAPWQR
jgi:hypothetical protein